MIDVKNVGLRIDKKKILKDISLSLHTGDIYGLLGPNGAGKSTIIFTLLGLFARTRGQIRVLGRDPDLEKIKIRQSVGLMPEHAGFYDWMTAPDYLRWYDRLFGQTISGKDLVLLLEKVGLKDTDSAPINTFSRGMKQRLAIARAMVTNPRLLILDEPTNGLDPKGRREIHNLLLEFAADQNVGVLLCTHLLDDVDRLCNRIGIIDNGYTRLEGSLVDLLAEQKKVRLMSTNHPENSDIEALYLNTIEKKHSGKKEEAL